jgi:hypothetical protein
MLLMRSLGDEIIFHDSMIIKKNLKMVNEVNADLLQLDAIEQHILDTCTVKQLS